VIRPSSASTLTAAGFATVDTDTRQRVQLADVALLAEAEAPERFETNASLVPKFDSPRCKADHPDDYT